MTEIDYNRFVYFHRNPIQKDWFNEVKRKLIEIGFNERRILNIEGVIHAETSDYVAYVDDIRQLPKLLVESVKPRDSHSATEAYGFEILGETVLQVDLFDTE